MRSRGRLALIPVVDWQVNAAESFRKVISGKEDIGREELEGREKETKKCGILRPRCCGIW